MFEKLVKRPYYIRRHVNAPLLAERIKYLECGINRGTGIHKHSIYNQC
ncbi:MAG TPA: hypothetical protein VKR58_00265 [Aquella sp.]|nr:hypothetical protein [Aquella sp.]